MYPYKTNQLIEWLETTRPCQQFSLQAMKELLSIAMAEIAGQNDKSFDALPYAYIDDIIVNMKISGEFYQLDNKIEKFKSHLIQQSEKDPEI